MHFDTQPAFARTLARARSQACNMRVLPPDTHSQQIPSNRCKQHHRGVQKHKNSVSASLPAKRKHTPAFFHLHSGAAMVP
jgi:hypothetical protein